MFLVAALGTGCSGHTAKNDLAGFSFESSREDLEKQGFACKEAVDDFKLSCTNLDWAGSVLGKDVRGLRIGISEKRGHSHITASLVAPPTTLGEVVEMQSSIDRMYTRLKDQDIVNGAVVTSFWSRPDGSTIKLVVFPGIPGMTKTTASIVALSPG